jgi:myo-inositol-1(or 4)-monophosphatase
MQVAQQAAEAGAKVVMEAVDKPRNIQFKGSTSDLVTDTDRSSEESVLAVIRQAFPDHAVLGEEGGVSGAVQCGC